MLDLLRHRPQLLRFILSHCVEVATAEGIRVTLLENTRTRTVSLVQLLRERQLLGESSTSNAEEVERRLAALQKKGDKERAKAKEKKKKATSRDAANVVHSAPMTREELVATVAAAVQHLEAARAADGADHYYAAGDFVGRTRPRGKRDVPAPAPATPDNRPTDLPSWAPAGAVNLRRLHGLSEYHFTGVAVASVGEQHVCVEGFVDSGAGSSLWDLRTA